MMLDLGSTIISFIGSVLLALAVMKNPGGAYQEINGKKIYLAAIKYNLFMWGLGCLALGFVFQIIEKLLNGT